MSFQVKESGGLGNKLISYTRNIEVFEGIIDCQHWYPVKCGYDDTWWSQSTFWFSVPVNTCFWLNRPGRTYFAYMQCLVTMVTGGRRNGPESYIGLLDGTVCCLWDRADITETSNLKYCLLNWLCFNCWIKTHQRSSVNISEQNPKIVKNILK